MKSFLLSFLLSVAVFFYFISLFDSKTNHFYNQFPAWVFIAVLVSFLFGYLLALYWGITGIFNGQRILNFFGIGLSVLGVGMYVLVYKMETGNGKVSPQQFDHDITKVERSQQTAFYHLCEQTHTRPADVEMVYYWGMYKNPGSFVICIQQGNIIALQIKNKKLTDLGDISQLTRLNWLVLDSCSLTSIATLTLPLLQRLEVNHNQLTNLQGLENSPKVSWVDFRGNPVTDSAALNNHPNKSLYIANE